MRKVLVIAAILMAVALTGITSTTANVAHADESDTNTEQSIAQKNVGSGESTNFNCGGNSVDTLIAFQLCGNGFNGNSGVTSFVQ